MNATVASENISRLSISSVIKEAVSAKQPGKLKKTLSHTFTGAWKDLNISRSQSEIEQSFRGWCDSMIGPKIRYTQQQ